MQSIAGINTHIRIAEKDELFDKVTDFNMNVSTELFLITKSPWNSVVMAFIVLFKIALKVQVE